MKTDTTSYELPLASSPITSFVRWFHTLSITCIDPGTEGWILNNFINLSCTTYYGRDRALGGVEKQMVLDFWRGGHPEMLGNNPFLQSRIIGYDRTVFGLSSQSVVEAAIDALKDESYPLLYVDESVLPFSPAYGAVPFFPHRILIRGACLKKREFHIYAFGGASEAGSYGRLGTHVISFEVLRYAAHSMERAIAAGLIQDNLSVIFRLITKANVDPSYETEFNVRLFRDALKHYLDCSSYTPTNAYRNNFYVFGAGVYEELAAYFKCVTSNAVAPEHRRDVRHLQVLEEHHTLMARRINTACAQTKGMNKGRLPILAGEIARVAYSLRLLKVLLMIQHKPREAGDFMGIAKKIGECGSHSRLLLEQTWTELSRL